MCNHAGTLLTQLNCNIRYRNLIKGFRLKICFNPMVIKDKDLRVAIFCMGIIETQQNLWRRFKKGIAGWVAQVERHIRLSHQLASINFAHLNKEGHKLNIEMTNSPFYHFQNTRIRYSRLHHSHS